MEKRDYIVATSGSDTSDGEVPERTTTATRDPQPSTSSGDQPSTSTSTNLPSTNSQYPEPTSDGQNPSASDIPLTSQANSSSSKNSASSVQSASNHLDPQPSTTSGHGSPSTSRDARSLSRDSGISTGSSSNSQPSNAVQMEDTQDVSDVAMDPVEPEVPRRMTRSSTRAQARELEEENRDQHSNSKEGETIIPRDVIPPIGIFRRPFHQIEGSSLEVSGDVKNYAKEVSEDVKIYAKEPSVGNDYQASEVKMKNREDAKREKHREFPIFIPFEMLDSEALKEFKEVPDLNPDHFYPLVLSTYWNAIWRQWRGQVTFEAALEHLMKSEYHIPTALDTIDEMLLEMPQEMKPLCVAQGKELKENFVKRKLSNYEGKPEPEENTKPLTQLQKECMRNYHLGEINDYQWNLNRFQISGRDLGKPCNCHSILCDDWECEPRVSCTNCNRHKRKPHPTETNKKSPKLCFICDAYFTLTNSQRPANIVIFNDREERFIEDWNEREKQQKSSLTREEVEAQVAEENTERWKRLKLTEEEMDMIPKKEVENIKPGKALGKSIADHLQPFVLPHFKRCQCGKSGGVS